MPAPQTITAHVTVGLSTYSAAVTPDGNSTRVTIARDGIDAGKGRWYGMGITECSAALGDDAYEALDRAIGAAFNARFVAIDAALAGLDAAERGLVDVARTGGDAFDYTRPHTGAVLDAAIALHRLRDDLSRLHRPTSWAP